MVKIIVIDDANNRMTEVPTIATSAGAGDAGKVPHLSANGTFDMSMMPAGLATPDKQVALTAEALALGDYVNFYDNAGVLTARKAIAADATKPAHGFVKQAYASAASATVYVQGVNSIPVANVSGFGPADRGKKLWLSTTTGGAAQKTVPTAAGQLAQVVGDIIGSDATYIYANFVPDAGIVRA